MLVATGGRLHALDASGPTPGAAGLDRPGRLRPRAAGPRRPRAGDRRARLRRRGRVAAQVGIAPAQVARPHAADRGRHLRSARDAGGATYDVEGSYLSARLTGATARVVVATEPRGLEMPGRREGATRGSCAAAGGARCAARGRGRGFPPACCATRPRAPRSGGRAVRCKQVRRPRSFSGLGTLTVLTVDMRAGPAGGRRRRADDRRRHGLRLQDRLYVARAALARRGPDRAARCSTRRPPACTRSTSRRPARRAYVGSGEVPGYLLNQFSLSEHKGVLRVATTSMPPWESARPQRERGAHAAEERGGRLAQVGAVGGLGEGERIFAVRFMGDTGFVVTFRQTDPLYTLDLADPRDPEGGRRAEGARLLGLPAPDRRRAAARRRAGRDRGRAGRRACSCRCSTSPTCASRRGSTSSAWARTRTPRSRTTTTRSPGGRPDDAGRAARASLRRPSGRVPRLARVPGGPRGRDPAAREASRIPTPASAARSTPLAGARRRAAAGLDGGDRSSTDAAAPGAGGFVALRADRKFRGAGRCSAHDPASDASPSPGRGRLRRARHRRRALDGHRRRQQRRPERVPLGRRGR